MTSSFIIDVTGEAAPPYGPGVGGFDAPAVSVSTSDALSRQVRQ